MYALQYWAMFRRNIGYEAVLKLRCSQGLRVAQFSGAFCNRTGQEVDLAVIDSDKCIMVNLVSSYCTLCPRRRLCTQLQLLLTLGGVAVDACVLTFGGVAVNVCAPQIHDGGAMKAGGEVFLQCAMVYTTPQCERRIRVHTLALPVSSETSVVFRHLDLDSVTNVLLRNGEASHMCGLTCRWCA